MGNSSPPYTILPPDEVAIELERLPASPHSSLTPLPLSLIKRLILEGEISQVVTYLSSSHLTLMQPGSQVYLALHTQSFIELLRANQTDALIYAQQHLSQYKDCHFQTHRNDLKIRDLMGLMCYRKPEESDVGYLMNPGQRLVTVEVVLRAIQALQTPRKRCHYSQLCRCFRSSRPH